MKYVYPAVFGQEERGVYIIFPDVPGCLPCADDYAEAFKNAKEALSLHIYSMLKDGESLPAPSRLEGIALEKNEALALIETEDLDNFQPDWELENE